jgi:hypothetical protein
MPNDNVRNMEHCIVGFPATESLNRRAMRNAPGDELAQYFFDPFLDASRTTLDHCS